MICSRVKFGKRLLSLLSCYQIAPILVPTLEILPHTLTTFSPNPQLKTQPTKLHSPTYSTLKQPFFIRCCVLCFFSLPFNAVSILSLLQKFSSTSIKRHLILFASALFTTDKKDKKQEKRC